MPVWIPPDVAGSCCGVPWSSKGYREGAREKANEMVERLWRWSGDGRLPIVIDASSCTHGVADPGEGELSEINAARHAKLELLDSVAWAQDLLLAGLEVRRKVASATVHPTCSVRHMGLTRALEGVAGAAQRGGPRADPRDLLRVRRRSRLPASGADRRGDPRGGGGGQGAQLRRPPLQQPHLRGRARARHRRARTSR